MSRRIRAVLDAHVWARGLTGRRIASASSEILRLWRLGVFDVSANGTLIDEVVNTLTIAFELPAETVEEFVAIVASADGIVPIRHQRMGCVDPNDDHLLETAVTVKASYVVTEDRRLLHLPRHVERALRADGVETVTPMEFLAVMRRRMFSPLVRPLGRGSASGLARAS